MKIDWTMIKLACLFILAILIVLWGIELLTGWNYQTPVWVKDIIGG